ncbi:GNAT family N-acetyltransferase [Streptomyces sp. NBC_01497]|uniref:GNAT family N-acetyltransferase n=1 Tax=Streptomyces sp. NBC_01497 TaxID=2903885 RepID=UPI002E353016|nr:GNAT family N-acetyltransferase [Streptomyces sp. NBC_01497]
MPDSADLPHSSGVTIRPLADLTELDLFRSLPYGLNDEIEADLDAGRRRLPWLWIALRHGRVVARAGWWARQEGAESLLLDIFDLESPGGPHRGDTSDGADTSDATHCADGSGAAGAADRVAVGAALLRAAMARLFPGTGPRPGYCRFLPPDWREIPEESRALGDRVEALQSTGARPLVERLRLQWLPGDPVPGPSKRLRFRHVASRGELVDLMTGVLDGTLDAHSRSDLSTMTARRCAEEQYDGELARYRSPQAWWRVATLPDGEPVGFVVPARNAYGPIIAYLGVLPAHRGAGYVTDVLGEGTRVLAAAGAERVRASTDVGNTPMARAFARAGYATFERQLDMTWEA